MIPRAFPGAKLRGVWPAIVVDNQDGPGNPGYRVRVKLPWLNDQETTHWARIALPMAGPGRGTYVLPEIHDQVLVVFEHGDIARPIVVGALWSKQQEPVEVNESGSNNTKLIKSRSGHRIVFDDKDGAEKITIVDSTRKNKIVLDSTHRLVRIESEGDIAVIAKANVILHANALKLGTSQQITGKGSSVLAHSARTFSVKAASSITIGVATRSSTHRTPRRPASPDPAQDSSWRLEQQPRTIRSRRFRAETVVPAAATVALMGSPPPRMSAAVKPRRSAPPFASSG